MIYPKQLLLAAILLMHASCATMFNGKSTPVTVITSQPTNLVIEKDTIRNTSTTHPLSFPRHKKPIVITAFTAGTTRTVIVRSKNSFAYWLNLYPNWHFWTGFYIDTRTKKRYTYPRHVYIDLNAPDSAYLPYKPLDTPYRHYSNIVKLAPLKLIGLFNPSVDVSYERRTGQNFSTQFMASYLLPKNILEPANGIHTNAIGYRISVEERWYINRSAPLGTYVGLEFDHLNKVYTDVWSFGRTPANNPANYTDTFTIKKQTYSISAKIGHQFISKRFSFDLFVGLGLRYRDVLHTDRIDPNDVMELPRHPNIPYNTALNGKYWTASLPLNLKLGYTF